MPYPNEHSCRLEDPDKYDRFNRENCAEKHDGKCIDVIYGIKNNKLEIQALRYKTDIWNEDDARAHCKSREGTFEAAAEEKEKKSMNHDIERRTFDIDSIEIRSGENGEQPKIRGHAAVFDKMSEDLGGFREIVDQGAFTSSLKRDDVRALFNHDPNYILGRNMANTLTLEEDEKGLAYEIYPPDTQYARDLMVSIERGDITQCSFAFRIDGKKGERWEVDGKEVEFWDALSAIWDTKSHDVVRHVIKARLYDVSPVTYPAYPQTDVKVRAVLEDAGIDYESVCAVIMRQRKGKELTEEDKQTVRKAVDILQGYLPEPEEPGEESSREDTGGISRLEYWRRRLEVIAKE